MEKDEKENNEASENINNATLYKAELEDDLSKSFQWYTEKKAAGQNERCRSKDTDEEIDVVNFSSPDSNMACKSVCNVDDDEVYKDRLFIVDGHGVDDSSEQSQISNYDIFEFPKNPSENSSPQLEKKGMLVSDIRDKDSFVVKSLELNDGSDLCNLSAVDINNSLFDTIASLGQPNIKPESQDKQTSLESIVNRIKSEPGHYHIPQLGVNCRQLEFRNLHDKKEPSKTKKKKHGKTSPNKTKKQRFKKIATTLENDKRMEKQEQSKSVTESNTTQESISEKHDKPDEKICEDSHDGNNENRVLRSIPMKLKLKNFCKAQQLLAMSNNHKQIPDVHKSVSESSTSTTSSQSTLEGPKLGKVNIGPITLGPTRAERLKYYENKKHLLECKLKILGLHEKIIEKKNMQNYLKHLMYKNIFKVKSLEGNIDTSHGSSSSTESIENVKLKPLEKNYKNNSCQNKSSVIDLDLQSEKSTKEEDSCKAEENYQNNTHTPFEQDKNTESPKKSIQNVSIHKNEVMSNMDKEEIDQVKLNVSKEICELPVSEPLGTDKTKNSSTTSRRHVSQSASSAPNAPMILVPKSVNSTIVQPLVSLTTAPPGRYVIGTSQLPNYLTVVPQNNRLSPTSDKIVQGPCNKPGLSFVGSGIQPIASSSILRPSLPATSYRLSKTQTVLQNPNMRLVSPPYRSKNYPLIAAQPPMMLKTPVMSTTVNEGKALASTFHDSVGNDHVVTVCSPSTLQKQKKACLTESVFHLRNSFGKKNKHRARLLRKKRRHNRTLDSIYSGDKSSTSAVLQNNNDTSTKLDLNNNTDTSNQQISKRQVYSESAYCSSDSQESFDSVDWQRYKDACNTRKPGNDSTGEQHVAGVKSIAETVPDKSTIKEEKEVLSEENNCVKTGPEEKDGVPTELEEKNCVPTEQEENGYVPTESKVDHSQVHIQDIPAKTRQGRAKTKKLLKTKFIVLRGVMCDYWERIKGRSGYKEMSDQVFFQHLLKLVEVRQTDMAKKITHKESGDASPCENSKTCLCLNCEPQTVCSGAACSYHLKSPHTAPMMLYRTPEKQTQCAGDATPCESPIPQTVGSVTATETRDTGDPEAHIVIDETPEKNRKETLSASDEVSKSSAEKPAEKVKRANKSIAARADKKRKLESNVDEKDIVSYPENKKLRFLSETTKRQMAWAVFIFKDFLIESGEEDIMIHTKTASWLNKKLATFYSKASTLDGEPYQSDILQEFRRALSMAMTSTSSNIKQGISFDSEYMTSNVLLSCIIRAEEKRNTKPANPIPSEDIDKLYSTKVFSDEHPLSLIWKVWFDIVQHMCCAKMPRNFLYCLKKQNLSLESDIHGVFYKFVDLGFMPGIREPGRMYATPTVPDRCPVRTLSLFLSRLSEHCPVLFQCPSAMWRYPDQTWYFPEPLKREHLYCMMETISGAANLSAEYTTANVLATPVVKVGDEAH